MPRHVVKKANRKKDAKKNGELSLNDKPSEEERVSRMYYDGLWPRPRGAQDPQSPKAWLHIISRPRELWPADWGAVSSWGDGAPPTA